MKLKYLILFIITILLIGCDAEYNEISDVTLKTNKSPTADAGIDKNIVIGTELLFNALNSTDSDGEIIAYKWHEGNIILSQKSTFKKSDFTLGRHTIVLTVTDNDGSIASDSIVITINNKPNRNEVIDNSDTKQYVEKENNNLLVWDKKNWNTSNWH